jgi:hypothetical protein
MTVSDVVNQRRATLMERFRVGQELGLLEIGQAAAITEEMAILLAVLQAYVAEIRRDAA